jgi:hypothetical protein
MAQAITVQFNIDVYAVDDSFNVAPGADDTVSITTSDPGDTEPSPKPLVQGHAVFQIRHLALGAWSITPSGGPGTNLQSEPYQVTAKITTAAGNGLPGLSGDGGLATLARLTNPAGVLIDPTGNVFIGDSGNARVRKVNFSGIISTAAAGTSGATGMAMDSKGNLYIAGQLAHAVFGMAPNGSLTQMFGSGIRTGSIDGEGGDPRDDLGDGKHAFECTLNFPTDVALDAAGNRYIADKNNHRVRMVDKETGIITTIAGTGVAGSTGDGGQAKSAQLNLPSGIAFDSAGNLYIAENGGNRVRKVTPGGIISTVAGNGTYGFSGDGGAATSAKLASPFGVAIDGSGNLYIADANNHRIRKVDGSGVITTIAGNGSPGFSGDGGASTEAKLDEPMGVAVDCAGNIAIADTYNHRVRRLEFVVGVVAGSDADGDGLTDCEELTLGTSPTNPDTDGDGFKDKPDTSFAGVNTNTNMDNCPLVPNPDQVNTDAKSIDNGPVVAGDDVTVPNGDSLGDACDPDDDNDWLSDADEVSAGTDPHNRDTDGDRVVDGAELLLGSDPLFANVKPSCSGIIDNDRDCLPASVEALLGSSDNLRDTDGDGISDSAEVKGWGTSPAVKNSDGDRCDDDKEIVEINGDGVANALDEARVALRIYNVQDDDPNDGNPIPDLDMQVNPAFDINKDGVMNALDPALVALNSSMVEPANECDCR